MVLTNAGWMSRVVRIGIQTIGDLAQADQKLLHNMLGQNGLMLWMFANGLDTSPVSNIGAKFLIKSIGNSTTAPLDLITDEDIRITLMVLCESVSSQMREFSVSVFHLSNILITTFVRFNVKRFLLQN